MGRGQRSRPGHRGGKGFEGRGVRGSGDERWDPEGPDRDLRDLDRDLSRDLRDLYEDLQDPANDEYVWPEGEDADED